MIVVELQERPPVANTTLPYIKWTPAEWKTVAMAYLKIRPNYLSDPSPAIRANELAIVMGELPVGRHRPIPTVGGLQHFKAGFIKAFAELRREAGMEQAAAPFQGQHKKIFWTRKEFLALAREMHRVHPGGNYLASKELGTLRLSDIAFAQRVLPADRHRRLKAVTSVRKQFLLAFKDLKAELAQVAEKRADIAAHPERYSMAAPAPAAAANPYEVVFKPLIQLIVAEVMAQFKSQAAPPTEAAVAAAVTSSTKIDIPGFIRNMAEQVRPRRPKIGIVGPLPGQARELEQSYPDIEFVIKEGKEAAGTIAHSMKSALRVIAMTSFLNHKVDGVLSKAFKDRYCRVTGGVSSIKRQIEILITTGALA